jgi:hypothetical protein
MFSTTHQHGLVLCTCTRCRKHFCVDESNKKHQGAYVKPSTARKHKETDQKDKRARALREKQRFGANVLLTAMSEDSTGNATGRSANTDSDIDRHDSGSGFDIYDHNDAIRPGVFSEDEEGEICQQQLEDACVVEGPMQSPGVDNQVCRLFYCILLTLIDIRLLYRANEFTCLSSNLSYTTNHSCSLAEKTTTCVLRGNRKSLASSLPL